MSKAKPKAQAVAPNVNPDAPADRPAVPPGPGAKWSEEVKTNSEVQTEEKAPTVLISDDAAAGVQTRTRQITFNFDEFVGYGKTIVMELTNGMPRSFSFFGVPVTHENDDVYCLPKGHFKRGDALLVEVVESHRGVESMSVKIVTTENTGDFDNELKYLQVAGEQFDKAVAPSNAALKELAELLDCREELFKSNDPQVVVSALKDRIASDNATAELLPAVNWPTLEAAMADPLFMKAMDITCEGEEHDAKATVDNLRRAILHVVNNSSRTSLPGEVLQAGEKLSNIGVDHGEHPIYKDGSGIAVYELASDLGVTMPPGHAYAVIGPTGTEFGNDVLQIIRFQNGPITLVGMINGVQNEHLLSVLIHRTNVLNERFPCDENTMAIRNMKAAIQQFQARTLARQSRGVEGTNQA